MTQTPLADDIAFLRQIAEEGQTVPSLSGRFSLMWGTLVGLALIANWLTLKGLFFVSIEYVGAVWMGVGVVGGLLSVVLGRSLRDKPGGFSVGNQAEQAAWPVAGAGIFLYAVAAAYAVIARGQPVILFDTIMPVAFLVYAVNIAMSARLFRRRQTYVVCGVALVFSVATMVFVGTAEVYLAAAIGVVLTQVLPGIVALRNEPSTVV